MNLYNVILDCEDGNNTFFWSCEVTSEKEQNIQSLLDANKELSKLNYVVDEIELLETNCSSQISEVIEFSGKAYYRK